MAKSVELPKCNLYLLGSGLDKNGNKVVKLHFPNQSGFSIQTNGNLPKTGSVLRGLKTYRDMETLSSGDLSIISREACAYIKEHGSDAQKKSLKIYK